MFGTTPTLTGVAAILATISSLVTEAITWVGQYATAITANPIIEIFVVVAFVGLGVGLIRRMIKL